MIVLTISGSLASYDEFLSCDRMYDGSARRARVLDIIPPSCDIAKYGYCYEKGGYPDDAIKQFLQENLGLMKRMSSEMNPHDVRREMRSNPLSKYSEDQQHHAEREREFKSSSFSLIPETDNMFNGLRYDIDGQLYNLKKGSGLAMVQNAKDESLGLRSRTNIEAVFRSDESKETTPTKLESSSSQGTTVSMMSSSISVSSTSQSTSSSSVSTSSTSVQPTTVQSTSKEEETSIAPSTTITDQPFTNTITVENIETVFPEVVQEATTKLAIEYDYEVVTSEGSGEGSGDYDIEDEDEDVVTLMPSDELTNLQEEIVKLDPEDLESILPEMLQTFDFESGSDEVAEVEEILEEEVEQLFEYTGDSINACEVHETIEAPYWANNTRNQVLALLNLYPFEQYIHMETCKAEHDEMLCRPGCRCEQQYRLHRLLAFDPNNECRGIFSDWFRFPSFCLCKCYSQATQIKEVKMKKSLGGRTKKEITKTPTHNGPGPTHNVRDEERKQDTNHQMTRDSKLINHQMQGIPAVFPYEGKAALFAEMLELDPTMLNVDIAEGKRMDASPRGMEYPQNTEIEKEDPIDIILDAITDEHMDNTVESDQTHAKKSHKESRQLDDHFFYSQPIVEFKLPDGTVGTIQQTPRK